MDETARRDRIIKDLVGHLASAAVEGVLLQGSMYYGRDHCVTAESDIDLLLVVEPSRIHEVIGTGPFTDGIVNEWAKKAFANEDADCIWDGLELDGVVINPGYLSLPFFERWTKLEAECIRRNRAYLPSGLETGDNQITGRTIDGTPAEFVQTVTHANGRYNLSKPAFSGDLPVRDPLYGSVLLSKILIDKSDRVQGMMQRLETTLKERFGVRCLLNEVDYGLRKASPEFRRSYLRRIGCEELGSEYEQRQS